MKTNNNKNALCYYINKPVYRLNSKFNEGEYINNSNYTIPKRKQEQKPWLCYAIECINYRSNNNPDEKKITHLNWFDWNKKLIEDNNIASKKNIYIYNKKMKN